MLDVQLALDRLESVAAAARAVTEIAAAARDTAVARSWLLRALRRLRREYPGDARLQILYWEVLFNATILRQGQRLRPPTLLVTTDEWHREGTAEALSRLTPVEITVLSGAYGQVEMFRWYFSRSYMALFADRVTGEDQKVMQTLRDWFIRAEAVLRPKAFSGRDLPDISKAVEDELKLSEPEARKRVVPRVHGAMLGGRNTEQVVYLTIILGALALVPWRLVVHARALWRRWHSRLSGMGRLGFT